MDQNHFQYDESYTPFRVKKKAADYRARAREILKPCYWAAFVASFVAAVLGGVTSSTVSFSVSYNTEDFKSIINFLRQDDWMSALAANPVLMVMLAAATFGALFALLVHYFVGAPVTVGYQKFNLDMVDGEPAMISTLFAYFKKAFGKSVLLRLVYDVIIALIGLPLTLITVALLWFNRGAFLQYLDGNAVAGDYAIILLILLVLMLATVATAIVQILVQYRYAFCFMILAEYPEIGVLDALRNSAALMKGNKWRYFCLNISFIGWILLASCCTCGIGALFLAPYVNAASAVFYDDVANRKAGDEVEFPSIDPDDYAAE